MRNHQPTADLDNKGGRTCFMPLALSFSFDSTGECDLDRDRDLERSFPSPRPDRLEWPFRYESLEL